MGSPAEQGVRIGLSAVVIALRDRKACVLTTPGPDGGAALPFGPFDPARDRTFELALRDFVTAQTGFRLGFVEQLYTFGDLGRASPRATPGPERRREVSVGYLALTADAADAPLAEARWTPVLDIFPWEDRRDGDPACLAPLISDLTAWAAGDARRQARIDSLFAATLAHRWSESRVLERYELLYEAGLVAESARDQNRPPAPGAPGRSMVSDHRRILATGLGRLRSKLKYRPVLFDLMPPTFTLSELQSAAEAIAGLSLHKQNFRRGVERTSLVQPTGRLSAATGGRPAELFRVIDGDLSPGEALGLPLPAQR
ncbi:NUDIX hydrolase [Brevundimonas sp.]|uniref:NUDIX hydrolase n=1 Tax=Brevundimonas sp. TaxID=1871086 RepID=UPI003F6E645C